MRVGESDNSNFYLLSAEMNNGERFLIDDIPDYESTFADIHKKVEGNRYTTEKAGEVELGRKAYDYLLGLFGLTGVRSRVRLIVEEKDETKETEDYIQISDVGINMATLSFDDTRRTVKAETITGTFLDTLEARWDDEYDITAEGLSELPYVNIWLEPRALLRRSRLFIEDDTDMSFFSTATPPPIPFREDFKSDDSVTTVVSNSIGSNGSFIYQNATRTRTLLLEGSINLRVLAFPGGAGTMEIFEYYYENGEDFDFKESNQLALITNIDVGDVLEYDFNREITLRTGESYGLVVRALLQAPFAATIRFYDTFIKIREDDQGIPPTYTKALKPKDAFQRMSDIILDEDDKVAIKSEIFDNGDKWENVLLVHGSWIRNVPQVINEGEDDERRIQCNLSLKDLYDAYKILEPLRYDAENINGKDYFTVSAERETQLNFIGIDLSEFPVIEQKTRVMTENFYGKVNLGSTTSGSNYGQVNNLYSISGNGNWETFNKKIKESYEVTTEFRTGAEDVELQRQIQYFDEPEKDGEYDNDWFLIHTKKVGDEYRVVKWADLFAERPTGVYDADSNYNWIFRPRALLEGHGWKIKSCLDESSSNYLRFAGSNCSASLVTKRTDETAKKESDDVYHNELERATVTLLEVEFGMPVRQSVITQLNGKTNGIDNRFGLVRYRYRGNDFYGRLLEGDTNRAGSFKLVTLKQ